MVIASDTFSHTLPGAELLEDRLGTFAAAYGGQAMSYLVRSDKHIGWRGHSWQDAGFRDHLRKLFAVS